VTKTITLHTIAAGPNVLADAGSIITVDDKFGKALLDGKFGIEGGTPGRRKATAATAVFDPAAEHAARVAQATANAEAAELTAKSADSIKAALAKLDPTNDDHWTAAGLPAVGAVKEITGSTSLSRDDIVAAAPDFERPEPTEEEKKAATTGRTRGPRTSNT
jgi:hypothetical protein